MCTLTLNSYITSTCKYKASSGAQAESQPLTSAVCIGLTTLSIVIYLEVLSHLISASMLNGQQCSDIGETGAFCNGCWLQHFDYFSTK